MIFLVKYWRSIAVFLVVASLSIYIGVLKSETTGVKDELHECQLKCSSNVTRMLGLEAEVVNRDMVINDYIAYVERLKKDYNKDVEKYSKIVESYKIKNINLKKMIDNYEFSDNDTEANSQANDLLRGYLWSE